MCSTPSGITARGTQCGVPSAGSINLCSTPSGITARGTQHPTSSWFSSIVSAQRLPASRRGELRGDWHHARHPACVLNAFRHHGEGNGAGDSALHRRTRAQRLPASRRGERVDWGGIGGVVGGCSTPSGITARGTRPPPAGARCSRAQRLPASRRGELKLAGKDPEADRCSTPSGITARGTVAGGDVQPPRLVLNAFRHHGEGNLYVLQSM